MTNHGKTNIHPMNYTIHDGGEKILRRCSKGHQWTADNYLTHAVNIEGTIFCKKCIEEFARAHFGIVEDVDEKGEK